MTLRITREKGRRSRTRLRLEGRLVAEGTALLKSECLDLLLTRDEVLIDLAGVVFVDRAGVEVLRRLARAGVEIHCPSRLIASVLEGEGVHVTVDTHAADEGRP
jgi:anti-anti-sigma regulatory factor